MQAAKSIAVRLAVTLTFHQGRCAVKEDEQIGASVALIVAVVALGLVWLGRNGLTHLANKLDLALIKTDNGALRHRSRVHLRCTQHIRHPLVECPTAFGATA
jgi:hypothetical protein